MIGDNLYTHLLFIYLILYIYMYKFLEYNTNANIRIIREKRKTDRNVSSFEGVGGGVKHFPANVARASILIKYGLDRVPQ